MDFYPRDFGDQSRARVESEQILARREFESEKTKEQKPVYDRNLHLISKNDALLRHYILRVFLAFAKEACALGHDSNWTVDRINAEAAEFLRKLTIHIYFEEGYGSTCPTSNMNGSLNNDIELRFKQSPQWKRFEDILLQVASTQASRPGRGMKDTKRVLFIAHKPLSNPLTAEEHDGHSSIWIDSFTMSTSRGNVYIENSGSITALACGTIYRVYFDEPDFTSQSKAQVTYNATIRQISAGFGGRFFVGSIRTPDRGASPTAGNDDGGTGNDSEATNESGVVREKGRPNGSTAHPVQVIPTAMEYLIGLADKFHSAALRLRSRHANRPPFLISDEYDVQDLFAALLETRFEDIRREEWGPSYAGGATRADFFLRNESMIFETKMTRDGLNDRKVGEELIIDIAHYRERPKCKTLVCFVYDPEHRLTNPRGLENDLSKEHDGFHVRVLIRPKS